MRSGRTFKSDQGKRRKRGSICSAWMQAPTNRCPRNTTACMQRTKVNGSCASRPLTPSLARSGTTYARSGRASSQRCRNKRGESITLSPRLCGRSNFLAAIRFRVSGSTALSWYLATGSPGCPIAPASHGIAGVSTAGQFFGTVRILYTPLKEKLSLLSAPTLISCNVVIPAFVSCPFGAEGHRWTSTGGRRLFEVIAEAASQIRRRKPLPVPIATRY